jgi:hypothetical protein
VFKQLKDLWQAVQDRLDQEHAAANRRKGLPPGEPGAWRSPIFERSTWTRGDDKPSDYRAEDSYWGDTSSDNDTSSGTDTSSDSDTSTSD